MKKTLIMMAVAAIGLTSCQKDELPQPSNTANRAGNNTNVVDSMDYTLDFRCDTLGLNVQYCHKWKSYNYMYGQNPTPNLIIGKTFRFTDAASGAEFTITYDWNGNRVVGDVSGKYLGYTFIDLNIQGNGNGQINMCGWYQGAKYKFRLRNSKGEVVFSNWGNAVSR
jgi:uncharacterized lipoprotein YehR (DUF1307 family)